MTPGSDSVGGSDGDRSRRIPIAGRSYPHCRINPDLTTKDPLGGLSSLDLFIRDRSYSCIPKRGQRNDHAC